MELLDAIRSRRTSNGPFRPDPVKVEHQRLLLEAASRAPSH
jgi:nitroreductase